MRYVLKRIFEFKRFFVRFLVFEIWSILYSTVRWGAIFANLIQTLTSEVGDSTQEHPGPGGRAPGGEYEEQSPSKKRGCFEGQSPPNIKNSELVLVLNAL